MTHFRFANYLLLAVIALACGQSESPPKYQDDIAKAQGSEAARILDEVKRAAGRGAA